MGAIGECVIGSKSGFSPRPEPPASGTWFNSNDGRIYQFSDSLGKWVSSLEPSFSFGKNGNINSANYLFYADCNIGSSQGGAIAGYSIAGVDYGLLFEKASFWIKASFAAGFVAGTTLRLHSAPPDGSTKTNVETFAAPATGNTYQADFTTSTIIPAGHQVGVRYVNTNDSSSSYIGAQFMARIVYDA